VTLTASYQRSSPDPNWFFSQASRFFRRARQGTVLAPAKNLAQMSTV